MRFVAHLLRWDVRRFRWLIAAWIALVSLSAVLQGLTPVLDVAGGHEGPVQLAVVLLLLARLVLGATLVARIIQAHPLVGTTAFWMTRPIPAGALMTSRVVLLAVLLVVIPALADAALMAAYHVPPAYMVRSLIDAALMRAAGATFVAGVAAFTATLGRFAVVSAAFVVATAITINLAVLVSLWRASGARAMLTSGETVLTMGQTRGDATADIVALAFFVGAGGLLLRAQHGRAPLRRTVPAGIAIPLIAAALSVLWPWHILHTHADAPSWANGAALSLTGTPDSVALDAEAVLAPSHPDADALERWRTARAEVHLRQLPGGWLAMARLWDGTLDFGNGRMVSRPNGFGATLPSGRFESRPVHQTLLDVLGVTAVGGFNLPRVDKAVILHIPERELPPGPVTGTYRGEFELELLQVTAAAALPLRTGATFQEGALRIVVDDVRYSDPGIVARARVSDADSGLDRRLRPSFTLFLRNARTREAVAANFPALGYDYPMVQVGLTGGWSIYLPGSGGFSARAQRIRFQSSYPELAIASPFAERPRRVNVTPAWMQDAEIIVVRTFPGGSVRRTLEMDGVTLKTP